MEFLEKICGKVRFSQRYVDLVMTCVEIVRYNLQLYEKASGQSVNFQNSSVCFSYNVSMRTRQEVCSILQVLESQS